MITKLLNADLVALQAAFSTNGYRLWFVGGCVRDVLRGDIPHDIDLSTDATPEEQERIYKSIPDTVESIIPRGLHHGTYTVVMSGEEYEITTLRLNGGYATTIEEDLSQRDFTINAMAMTFDGTLIDPYGGQNDLTNGNVRFVGDPVDRIEEDPLRILRWVRFNWKYNKDFWKLFEGKNNIFKDDGSIVDTIILQSTKLERVSKERIWTEVSKIIKTCDSYIDFSFFHKLHLSKVCSVPQSGSFRSYTARKLGLEPHIIMAAHIDLPYLGSYAKKWGWSSREKAMAMTIAERLADDISLDTLKRRAAVHHEPVEWLAIAARIARQDDVADQLLSWSAPMFPLTLDDVADPQQLTTLKLEWGYSGFRLSKASMLKRIAV